MMTTHSYGATLAWQVAAGWKSCRTFPVGRRGSRRRIWLWRWPWTMGWVLLLSEMEGADTHGTVSLKRNCGTPLIGSI